MNSSDRNARRDLGASYAALTVKSFASGLTPAARARAVFPAEFETSERAERVDKRIDALQRNYHTRCKRRDDRPPMLRQPVDLVDDDGIDPARGEVGEQPLQSRPVHRRA